MTWQDEKAKTQAAMRDIVAQVPQGVVVSVDMAATGILFECNQTGPNGEKLHSWTGPTSIAVKPGTDIESIVKSMESHYRESRFRVDADQNLRGNYRIQVSPPEEGSKYLISQDGPGQIRIAGWSECFQLPDGLYPGGDF
ncbi:hypothetical protein AB3K78_09600 [Leucobacter sp. HNU]|uniref:hypothetical protein n=1 Tax=Leucobacter sp. HNU TaxID=3236805 RepID=UPI003A80864C